MRHIAPWPVLLALAVAAGRARCDAAPNTFVAGHVAISGGGDRVNVNSATASQASLVRIETAGAGCMDAARQYVKLDKRGSAVNLEAD